MSPPVVEPEVSVQLSNSAETHTMSLFPFIGLLCSARRIGEGAEIQVERAAGQRVVPARAAEFGSSHPSDGKEGVDGSSPSEGFGISPAQRPFLLPILTADRCFD